MLPSFRLIVATFLCGFFVVFVGLRMAASLNDIHEGLPVMAAHAAPMTVTPAADQDARRGISAVPVMYDLRFAVSPVSPILVRATPAVFERASPLLPLAILPPEIESNSAAVAPEPAAPPETTVAAIERDMMVAPTMTPDSSAVVAEPLPALNAAGMVTPASKSEPKSDAATGLKAAAIDAQAAPAEEMLAEPLVAEPETTSSIEIPVPSEPSATPEPAQDAHAKPTPKAVAKPKPKHKPRVRSAARAAAPAANSFGAPNSNAFGSVTRAQ